MKLYDVLLNDLMELNLTNRKLYDFEKSFTPANYAEEFKTVRLDIGRRVGKSTYIKNNAHIGDIIIVPNYNLMKYYRDIFHLWEIPKYTFNEIKHIIKSDFEYGINKIYVDEASWLTFEQLQELYTQTGTFTNQYILLG